MGGAVGRTFGVVGEGGFAVRCTQTALERWGVSSLRFLASPDGSLAAIAAAHGVPHFATRREFSDAVVAEGVDRLFSLNNPWVIQRHTLDAVREIAVNFHDSLLPHYAGLHATTWAILNDEDVHGITLHEMAAELDAGSILVQREVPLLPDERAYSLNAKCLEAALDAFHELLEQLDSGSLQRRPAEAPRSYFGREHRPPSGGFFDPRRSASELERMVRALDFGPVPNPIGSPRVWVDGSFYVVRDVALGGEGPTLDCADGPLRLVELATLDGRSVPLDTVGEPSSPVDLDRWIDLDARWALHEGFWLRRWSSPHFVHPFSSQAQTSSPQSGKTSAHPATELSVALERFAQTLSTDPQRAGALLMAVYAARIGAATGGGSTIGFRGPAQRVEPGLYAPVVPMRVPPLDRPAQHLVQWLDAELAKVGERGSIALDAMSRRTGRHAPVPTLPVDVRWFDDLPAVALSLELTGEIPRLCSDGSLSLEQLVTIEGHLVTLARSLVRADVSAQDASLISPADHQAIEACRGPHLELNTTPVPLRVEQALEAAGTRVVLSDETESLDGETTRARVDAVARALIQRGLKPGDIVAVRSETPVEQAVALLGVLRAGATYTPVDPELPAARSAAVLEDASPRLVIGPADVPLADLLNEGTAAAALPNISLSDPAYVIFTSGSTGRPKGVVVSHANLASQLDARQTGYDAAPTTLATLHSLAFDSALAGLFWAITSGAHLVLSNIRVRRDPEAIRRLIAKYRPTHLDVPPSTWQEVLATATEDELVSLRVVIVGGEACRSDLVRSHLQRLPSVALYNEYGPTEATIYSTVHRVQHADKIPIGRPIANAHCIVVDPRGVLVPVNVPGELWIGGPGIAQGYLARPELSAKRFVTRDGERFYRTGDRVRLDAEGLLWFSGRFDEQVQIGGHRVEIGDVERALTALPEVARAVVSSRTRRGTTELIAHVVARGGSKVEPPALRQALSKRLPQPMIPVAIGEMTSIPLTPAGKIDRQALPPLVAQRPAGTPPRTPTEASIAAIVAEELGVERIGVDDDFFDSGGSSLVAMRVARRTSQLQSGTVRVVDLYRERTVARLARLIAGEPSKSTPPASPYLIPISVVWMDARRCLGFTCSAKGARTTDPSPMRSGRSDRCSDLRLPLWAAPQVTTPRVWKTWRNSIWRFCVTVGPRARTVSRRCHWPASSRGRWQHDFGKRDTRSSCSHSSTVQVRCHHRDRSCIGSAFTRNSCARTVSATSARACNDAQSSCGSGRATFASPPWSAWDGSFPTR